MNKAESSQIIEIIGSLYPNYNPMSMDLAVVGWSSIFAEVPYRAVQAALFSYTRENEAFPPTPGQIYSLLWNVASNEPTEAEAWNMVLKAIQRSAYFAQEEFDKLPETIQKAIGSPEYLRSLAISDDANMSVEASNFYRNYRTVQERKRQADNLPNGAKAYIEKLKAGTPLFDDKQKQAMLEMQESYEKIVEATCAKLEEDYEVSEPEPTQTGESFKESLWKRFGREGREANENDET